MRPTDGAIHNDGLARPTAGFTLLETMIAVSLFGLVIAGSLGVFIMCQKTWHTTALTIELADMTDLAIQRLVYGVGSNSGLRGAAAGTLALQTNGYGHPYPFLSSYRYWTTGTSSPPKADVPSHYVHLGCAYGRDGSWRLFFSNVNDGAHCIDYNKAMRNLLFCPDTNQTGAARMQRLLICNYVSSATATVDAAQQTVAIQFTVWKQNGMFIVSNQASAFIKTRL